MSDSPSTVVLCGASGYIGGYLRRYYEDHGIRIRTVGRGTSSDATWSDHRSLVDVLDGSDLVVNLAGRSVSCRYNKANADAIMSSRIQTTARLGRALANVPNAPDLWVNASTGTIYRDSRDRPMDERSGDIGSGFSVEVARAWERELFDAEVAIRKVALRMSIVLGAGGGAINPIIDLARVGLGGTMGDGGQMFSWVHVADVARVLDHLYDNTGISGPVNVATPFPVTNEELMRQVRIALGRSHGLPTPAWLLQFGARVIRTEAELVLKSRWVDPQVLTGSGFEFRYPKLDSALADIASETPRGLLPVALG
ncbi:TIGR01777 family protein [Rhodococcus sp. 05-2255-3B1]|uniref:TIGR01777 family oxidoreductase n=1 Tax=unclassified Rhodococcus (in: high G+C Gram-positive bacteria) TaxID=192944 RepID=UPI000B9B6A20|nr:MULTISPECIES: TIGR01777 family oxidoreductase [unclassified Rhodococcus (in: high G+C Gram-positive bacteria)]OZE02478.1 TIGR01777 family protein [Rhodococcus sp. 05-2255-3C]OZE11456.1 TIGR01777 family protein [Rhodococcus sp. 05-2255-3B1]OZE13181.1 TIGR01777 family protein [Rhodococcus sp. 05-2255-2A2]